MKSHLPIRPSRRATPFALFLALFLVVAGTVPVLAHSEEEPPANPIEPPAPASGVQLPGTEDIVQAHAEYVQREEEREGELASPAAQQQREDSRHAYTDLNDAEAEALLSSTFSTVLEQLNSEPARYLTDAKLDRPLGEGDANVTSEGKTALMEGPIPVEAENEEGELAKVDLSLEKTQEGFVLVNPLVEVDIGNRAQEGVEVGSGGMTVTQAGAESSSVGRPFGDKNVFFGEVEEGSYTDLLVSPVAAGVEMYDMLRSADSPETLRFPIETPEGSSLRTVAGGGVEVVSAEGMPLAMVRKPTAVDAQGTPVPVGVEVEGHSVVLHVEHREGEYAYPILVDPTVENLYQDWGWWYSGQHLSGINAWTWNSSNSSSWMWPNYEDSSWPGWHGLFVYTSSGNLPANGWGQWSYSAPNSGTYLANATINPFYRNNHTNCPQSLYAQPYDYDGMWNETSYNRILFNQANSQGWSTIESWGRAFIIGMGTSSGINIPCWRDIAIGGVGVWLEDWQYPYLNSVGATPEGWVKKDATPRTFFVSASDEGLGVRTVRMFGVGTQEWRWNKGWCKGTFEERCNTSESGEITFTTNGFPYEGRYNSEGKERKFTVQAIDPTEKTWQLERPLWLDGTPPVVSLKGQLATATDEAGSVEKPQETAAKDDELSLPTYNLEIEANDGADRSGVKEIQVFLDGSSTPAEVKAASCGTSCPESLAMTYTLRLPGLSPGTHSLRIVALDKVGNESDPNRNIEFEYIPATGMKEEYVLQHFRLPDGSDHSGEVQYHGPEIAVNVMNGNVVFHEQDAAVDTANGQLELERIYNSQQPTQKDTQWGRGWSLAQTPEFEPQPGSTPPAQATVTQDGKITSAVAIPQTQSQTTFSSKLHAAITKTVGGYEVEPTGADAPTNEVSVFNASGRIEEVVQGDNSPAFLEPEPGEPLPPTPPTYAEAFGSLGSGTGQFQHPAGIAVGGNGSIWVVDKGDYRVEKFNASGQYQSSFGSQGTGDGQFGRPTDIAIDSAGNLWVTDAGNNRVEKFNANGEFLAKFGTLGTGNGQFHAPESIAIDGKGNIWVADTYNARLQKFNSSFEFIKAVGTKGSGQGQLIEPTGIDIGPGNNVWVAGWGNNRVAVFGESGEFVRQFGSSGSGEGQFSHPDVIDVDGQGNVWVADEGNGRVQQFNQRGEFVTQFGAKGSGQGQFSFGWPMGIATDSRGNIWIADTGNNRVQRWSAGDGIGGAGGSGPAPYFDAPTVDYEYAEGKLTGLQLEDEATKGEDPSLEMTLSLGLVSKVGSEAAGNTSYGYEAGKLSSVSGTDGQTKYSYDTSGRLKKVTLPNGTYAEITYDSTSRATAVTVDPAGPETAKTTKFSYSAEPRRTIVWGGGSPEINYEIGEDGSVFKWSYAETPPTIASISGSLWSRRGEEIENKDHTLFVTGSSAHEVASIRVIANGNAVVAEKTCEDKSEPPAHNCDQPGPLEWFVNAAELPAGRLDLEVVVTDFLGHQSAERFFVIVPQQPPPNPEAPERPDFSSTKQFREENGLDRSKSLSQAQLNELALELLYEWEGSNETAMRAVEGFGVPMRAPELAEMEYRRSYLAQAAEAIPQWAEEHAPSTYGGYYVDNRAGGVIYVGFTENQHALVESLKQSGVLMAPEEVKEMPTPPTRSIANVEATEGEVFEFIAGAPSLTAATTSIATSTESGLIEVTSTNPELLQQQLTSRFGAGAPIAVTGNAAPITLSRDRFNIKGPVEAGDYLRGTEHCTSQGCTYEQCTADYSADNQVGVQNGQPIYAFYKLTAGHCFKLLEGVYRRSQRVGGESASVGKVRLSGWEHPNPSGNYTDGEAIEINSALAGGGIFTGNPHHLMHPSGWAHARLHREYCWSGFNGGKHCGVAFKRVRIRPKPEEKWEIVMAVDGANVNGDSGGPVWDPETEKVVGIVSAHAETKKIPCHEVKRGPGEHPEWCPINYFAPLLPFAGKNYPDGVLSVLGDPELDFAGP